MAEYDEMEPVFFTMKGGIYHRRLIPMMRDRKGTLVVRKSVCGHWFSFVSNRVVADRGGRFPCKTCFRDELA